MSSVVRRKIMIRITIALAAGFLIGDVSAESVSPPASWAIAFRDDAQNAWDRLLKNDGKVSAEEVIAEVRKRGSHHDGDCQMWTAFALLQLEDDPIPILQEMMLHQIPEQRAFGALVAGLLGDIRLQPAIKKLSNDPAKVGEFPGDWFWDTVGDAALAAEREFESGGVVSDWISTGGGVAAWLKRQPKKRVESGPRD